MSKKWMWSGVDVKETKSRKSEEGDACRVGERGAIRGWRDCGSSKCLSSLWTWLLVEHWRHSKLCTLLFLSIFPLWWKRGYYSLRRAHVNHGLPCFFSINSTYVHIRVTGGHADERCVLVFLNPTMLFLLPSSVEGPNEPVFRTFRVEWYQAPLRRLVLFYLKRSFSILLVAKKETAAVQQRRKLSLINMYVL